MPPSPLVALSALLVLTGLPTVVVAGGAAAQTAPAPVPGTAVVRDDATGGAVRLVPGQGLRVELGPADEPWEGLERSSPQLQLLRYDAARSGLGASFVALAPGGPLELVATAGERRWTVSVLVDEGAAQPARGCAPPSPAPSATAVPSASPTSAPPRGRTLSASDDGSRVTVRDDDPVSVQLDSCDAPYGPVTVTGPLRRLSAGASVPEGQAEAALLPTGAGTATLTAQRDVPCASRPSGACPTPWSVVVEVTPAPCLVTLTGPARVPSGGTAVLTGTAEPGEVVDVLFRRRGQVGFTVRRTLTADASGTVRTSFVAVDDHRYHATGRRCSSAPALTQVTPTVAGPARVARRAPARLVVRAAAGARVAVEFRRQGSAVWRTRRTGTADAAGRFLVTFSPDVDHAYRAVSLGRRSPAGITQAR